MATGSEIASAYIALTVKAPGVKRDIAKELGGIDSSRAGTQIGDKLAKSMKHSLQLAGVGIAAALGTALVKGFDRLKAIETAQAKMRGLGNDADTVAKAMDNSLAAVKGTAFGLGDAATAAGQLMAANIKPGKELEKVLKTVGNNAAAAGVGFDEMGSIFAKAATQANGVQNDILAQLADKGIPIYQALAEQMGVTAGEVFKMASEGKVDFATFSAAAKAAAGTVADEMGNTTTGSFNNLMAAMGRLGAKILQDIFPLIGPLFQNITKWLDEAIVHVEPLVAAFGVWLKDALSKVSTAVQGTIQWFQENYTWVSSLAIATASATLALKGYLFVTNVLIPGLKAAKVAMIAFNVALRANPIGIIVTAIGALVAGLVWFFTQTELGQAIWAEFTRFLGEAWANISAFFIAAYENVIKPIFEGIATVATWVFENVLQPAFQHAQAAWLILSEAVKAVWEGFLKPVFDGIGATVNWLWTYILQPIFLAIQFAFMVMAGILQGIWEFILKPVFDAIGAIFTWLWDTIISVIVGYIQLSMQAWGTVMTWLWETILQPVFAAIGAQFNWLWVNIIKPVVGWIKQQWALMGFAAKLMWEKYIQPAFKAIGDAMNWVWVNIIEPVVKWIQEKWAILGLATQMMYEQHIKPAWNAVSNVIKTVWEKVKSVIDTMSRVIKSDPKKAFEAARDAIGTAWAGIQDLAKKPVKFVIETVINGLINTVNGILPEGMKIPTVKLPKGFSEGGYTGNIGQTAVAGVVHGNEHVIRASSRKALESRHPGLLDHMNQYGSIPGYRSGGLVNPLPAGSYSVSQPYHGGHNGIDLAAAAGTKVFAAGDGVVGLAGAVNMGGNEVYVQHTNGLGTRYSHLSRFGTQAGAQVKAGNVIGYVGSTGMSTGPHLHYMVHSPGGGAGNYGSHVNPASFMGLNGKDLGEAGGSASILGGLVDWAVGKIKDKFPGGGMFIDIASSLAKSAATKMADAFNPFASSDGHTATLYDNGGLLPTGLSLVENKSGRPEPILTGSQWDALTADGPGSGRTININGNVGWDPDDLMDEIERREQREAALVGIGAIR